MITKTVVVVRKGNRQSSLLRARRKKKVTSLSDCKALFSRQRYNDSLSIQAVRSNLRYSGVR